MRPAIGKLTSRSQRRFVAPDSPLPSLPTTTASGPDRSLSHAEAGASWSAATSRSPRSLQLMNGLADGRQPGQEEVLAGSGAGLDGRRAERGGAALREDDTVDAGRLGRSEQRAEVRRILEVLEDEDERVAATGPRVRHDLAELGPATLADLEQHALVAIEAADARELIGGHAVDRQIRSAGRVGDGAQLGRRLRAGADEQPMRLTSGGERLGDRAAAADPVGHASRSTVATAHAARPSLAGEARGRRTSCP